MTVSSSCGVEKPVLSAVEGTTVLALVFAVALAFLVVIPQGPASIAAHPPLTTQELTTHDSTRPHRERRSPAHDLRLVMGGQPVLVSWTIGSCALARNPQDAVLPGSSDGLRPEHVQYAMPRKYGIGNRQATHSLDPCAASTAKCTLLHHDLQIASYVHSFSCAGFSC